MLLKEYMENYLNENIFYVEGPKTNAIKNKSPEMVQGGISFEDHKKMVKNAKIEDTLDFLKEIGLFIDEELFKRTGKINIKLTDDSWASITPLSTTAPIETHELQMKLVLSNPEVIRFLRWIAKRPLNVN